MNLDSHKILIVLHGSIGDVTRALPLETDGSAEYNQINVPRGTLAGEIMTPSIFDVGTYCTWMSRPFRSSPWITVSVEASAATGVPG